MKKTILTLGLIFLPIIVCNSQNDINAQSINLSYGFKGGYNSFTERLSFEGESVSDSGSGFYLGLFTDISISYKISIQPELLYVLITQDNVDGDVLLFPLMLKYKIKETFNVLLGPQLDYVLEKNIEGIKRLGIGLSAGVTFGISQHLFMDMRYSYGLNNRLDSQYDGFGAKFKLNFFQIGIGYMFN